MHNRYDAAWPQDGLGVGRALVAGVGYAMGMMTLAGLIAVCADGVARFAVPAVMAVLSAPSDQSRDLAMLNAKGASNAAIMAALEARPALLDAPAPATRPTGAAVTMSLGAAKRSTPKR